MRITTAQNDIERVLITQEQIETRVKELGEELTKVYEGQEVTLVSVLKGSCFFHADLCRAMKRNVFIDFLSVSSYGLHAQSTGVVKIIKDLDKNVTGRHILLVEDIIDSGLTLKYLTELLSARKPASVRTACLLDKKGRRQCDMEVDYCGFEIPDCFVVGYGLDYADYYRNLPYIGVLKPECYR